MSTVQTAIAVLATMLALAKYGEKNAPRDVEPTNILTTMSVSDPGPKRPDRD